MTISLAFLAPKLVQPVSCQSGRRGTCRGGAALDRRAWESKPDAPRRAQANPQARTGEDCRRLVEDLAESLSGLRSMRRAERSHIERAIGEADVACSGKQLMQKGSPLLIDAGVVRPQQRYQIALGLIGNHLDDVGQMLTFGGELDHGPLVVARRENSLER
jgi:hypothetical protein